MSQPTLRRGNGGKRTLCVHTDGICGVVCPCICCTGDFVPHVLLAVAPGAANRVADILVVAICLLLPLSLLKGSAAVAASIACACDMCDVAFGCLLVCAHRLEQAPLHECSCAGVHHIHDTADRGQLPGG